MSTVQRIPATPSTIQLRMNTRVAEPIPLGRLDSPPDEDDAASATDTAVQGDTNTATANTTVPSPQDQTNAPPPPTPTRRLSPVQSFARGAGFTNSLGTLALVAVVVFGIGAWVGMKIQISQGGKNMDLAIWTACADHEAIQDTALCKSILAKDFSQFEKRKERATEVETQLVKRGLAEDVTTTPGADTGDVMSAEKSEEEKKKPPGLSRYGKLLSGMSSTDRALVHTEPQVYTEQEHPPDPALRATFLPVVNLLTKPITAFFEFVEYMFLVVIYFVHKIFSWITSAFMLLLQAMIYSFFENMVGYFLAAIDMAILKLLPEWLPRIFFSDIASVLCLTGLRSYWYSTSYLSSLKWIMILRVCMWAGLFTLGTIVPLLWNMWRSSREAVQGRRSDPNFPSLPNPPAWFKPKAAFSTISSSFSSPNILPLQQDPSVAPKAQVVQRAPLRVNQKSKEEASAEELFYQSFGQPKSRGQRAGVRDL